MIDDADKVIAFMRLLCEGRQARPVLFEHADEFHVLGDHGQVADREVVAAMSLVLARIDALEHDLRSKVMAAEGFRDLMNEARRDTVEIAALARDGDDENVDTLRRVAEDYGWGYLYPESEVT